MHVFYLVPTSTFTDITRWQHTIVELDHIGIHRQPRFGYGPLLGLLLANFLSNSAVAKFAPLGSLRLSYDPSPWVPYNRPTYNSHSTYDPQEYWHPIKNPYGPPTPPTAPGTERPETQHIHHHHIINPPASQQQIVNINERPSTEIIIDDDTDDTDDQKLALDHNYSTFNEGDLHRVNTNIESPHIEEPVAAESTISLVQVSVLVNDTANTTLIPKNPVKRGAPSKSTRRNKNSSQKRKTHTTTPEYYYDSYEDLSTTRKNKPKRKKPTDSDEESGEEYDYDLYDFTTKPYKKRRRTTLQPKRNKNKNKKKQQLVTADDDSDEIDFRQRRPTTTPETIIMNGNTNDSNYSNTSGYGYGPYNGNEYVSITWSPQGEPQGAYGPPRPLYGPPRPSYGPPNTGYGHPSDGYYHAPYSEWYNNDATRNAIVKKVNDIIGLDNVF